MAAKRPPAKPRDPGAPVGKDEIDPELVSLRGPRAKIGALTALAMVVVCAYFLVRLFGDFSFSRSSPTPRTVTVDDITAGRVGADEVIELTAPVERSAATRLRTGAGDPGVRVVPVIGSDDRVWIAYPGDPGDPKLEEKYAGRLHELDAGPMGPALRDFLATPQPRMVTGDELRRARLASDGGGTLAAIIGPKITATADTQVEIAVTDPDQAIVVATFIDRLKDAKAWQDALAAAGVIGANDAPAEVQKEHAAWKVRTPDAIATITAKLEGAKLWATRVDPVQVSQRTTWRALAAAPDAVTIGGARIPWSAVDVAGIWAARPLPDGAYVLVVNEKPSDYHLVMPLYGALALFALLFAWALWRAVRRDFWPLPK